MLYDSVLLATSIAYLWGATYQRQHSAIDVLYVVFSILFKKYEKQELIWKHVHEFPSFNNIINSKGSRNVGRKLVWPAILCRVYFWPGIKESLSTPALNRCLGIYVLRRQTNMALDEKCEKAKRLVMARDTHVQWRKLRNSYAVWGIWRKGNKQVHWNLWRSLGKKKAEAGCCRENDWHLPPSRDGFTHRL